MYKKKKQLTKSMGGGYNTYNICIYNQNSNTRFYEKEKVMKKRKLLPILLALAMVLTMIPASVFAEGEADVWDGNADTNWYDADSNSFTISSADELAGLAQLVNGGNNFAGKTITLNANMDLNDIEWTPIGTSEKPFKGIFDGNGKTISNLYINRPFDNAVENNYVGLFGYTKSEAIIKDVNIENVDIQGSLYVGAVAGYAFTGNSISDCHVTGDIAIDAWWYVGGIGGNGYITTVSGCSVIGNDGSYIKANDGSYVGGIWGFRGEGESINITDCEVENINISGVDRVGGVSGMLHYGNSITGCSLDNVTAVATDPDATTVGKIAGACQGTEKNPSTVKNNMISETTTVKVGDKTVTKDFRTDKDGYIPVVENNFVASIGEERYISIVDALKYAKENDVVKITQPGVYKPFDVPDGVTVEGIIGDTAEKSTVIKNTSSDSIRILGESAVLKDLWIDSTDKATEAVTYASVTDGITIENCRFYGNGETGSTALYMHFRNITVKDCYFQDFERGYYTCGDNNSAGEITFTDNKFSNVRVPFDGYWGKPAGNDTMIKFNGNNIDAGSWEAAYVQLWDYAQYQHWLNGEESTLKPYGESAIKAEVKDNSGDFILYATHFNWYKDSDLVTNKEDIVYRQLIEIQGADNADVTVTNRDGSPITAFNESTASSDRGGKKVIYSLSVGEYIFNVNHKNPNNPDGDAVTEQIRVTVNEPTSESETQTITAHPPVSESDYYVAEATVKGTTTPYTSLEAAIEAAKEGGTVTLLQNVKVDTWEQIWGVNGLTLDGNGKKLIVGAVESNVNGNYLLYDAENLTVKNMEIDFLTNGNAFSMTSGTIDNVTVRGGSYGVVTGDTEGKEDGVTIKDSKFYGQKMYAVYTEENGKGANTVISNCTFDDQNYVIILRNNEQFINNTVNSGTVTFYKNDGVVTGNTFRENTTLELYDSGALIEKNKILGKVNTDNLTKGNTISLNNNYWGEGRTPADVLGEKAVLINGGETAYYLDENMSILNTDPEQPGTVDPSDPEDGNGQNAEDQNKTEAKPDASAQTGDGFNMAVPFAAAGLALAAIAAAVATRKRHN